MKITNLKSMPDGSGALEFDKRWDIETNEKPKSKVGLRTWLIGALTAAGLLGTGAKTLNNMQAASQVEAKPVAVSFESSDTEIKPVALKETAEETQVDILALLAAENAQLDLEIAAGRERIKKLDEEYEEALARIAAKSAE